MTSSDENVLQFIRASFPSVWALELLLMLKRDQRVWSREQLVAGLRASELVISKALDALVAAGLASIDSDGARYTPVNPEAAGFVERVEQLYRSRPNAVRRAIISASAGSASAFANAFKLRGEADD